LFEFNLKNILTLKKQLIVLFFLITKMVYTQSFIFDLNHKIYGNQYPILIHAHSDSFLDFQSLNKSNLKITSKIGNYSSVLTSISIIKHLYNQKWVYQLENGGKKLFALSDSVRIHSNIDSAYHGNSPLLQPYRGDSVIVGIVDFGLEWRHRDFQHADSTSRILFFWNQNKDSIFPNGFNYGMEWKKSHFDAKTCNHIETLSVHGTNSAGNAAGNGTMNPNYRGVAPRADIISVSIKNNANSINNIVDGIRYIFNKADSLNKPCVVNVSIGTYEGSHDGMDIASLMVDSLVKAKKGRAVVFASGNAAHIPHHIQMQPTASDTFFTDFIRTPAWGGTYFMFWSDTQDFKNLKIGIRADTLVTLAAKSAIYSYDLKNQFFDSVVSKGFYQIDKPCLGFLGDTLGVIQVYSELEKGGIRTEVFIPSSKTNLFWRFLAFGGGKLDMWVNSGLQTTSNTLISPLPSSTICPEIGKYKIPDNDISICSGFQCSPNIITVGNYVNKEGVIDVDTIYRYIGGKRGEIASSSSKGPTRKGLMKPEISAPGGGTFAAVDFSTRASFLIGNRKKLDVSSYYSVNGGTSMSAPVVAGAIALMLQKDKNLSHTEIAYLIKKNARKDTFSSIVENNTYGSGKLNVFQTLKYPYRYGCKLDTSAFNYDSTIDFHRQDSCIQKVYGCMDSLAINYNPLANVNNGSCIYGAWNIKELQFSKILIFPNPASSIVNIENKSNQPIQIEIRNLYSQLIKNGLIDKKITWDVSEWARGIYFIQVVENEIYSTIKLILK
jgi:subtilisin family serine protease